MSRIQIPLNRFGRFNVDKHIREALDLIVQRLNEVDARLSSLFIPSGTDTSPPTFGPVVDHGALDGLIPVSGDQNDDHSLYLSLAPETDVRNVITPTASSTLKMAAVANGHIAFNDASADASWGNDRRGLWLSNTATIMGADTATGYGMWIATNALWDATDDNQLMETGRGSARIVMSTPASPSDDDQAYFDFNIKPPSGTPGWSNSVSAASFRIGTDGRGKFIFGGDTSRSGAATEHGTFNQARVYIEAAGSGAEQVPGLVIESISNSSDQGVPLWAAIDANSGTTASHVGRFVNLSAGTSNPELRIAINHTIVSDGATEGPSGSVGDITRTTIPTLQGFTTLTAPQDVRVDLKNHLWIDTDFTNGDAKCRGGIRMDNWYILGVHDDGSNDYIKAFTIDANGLPDTEAAVISAGSIEAAATGPFVLRDGTSVGAAGTRQDFTDGVSTPTGSGGGIIFDSGGDSDCHIYESSEDTLAFRAGGTFLFYTGGTSTLTLPGTNGIVNIDPTQYKAVGANYAPGTAAVYTWNVKDSMLVESNQTSSVRPVLNVTGPQTGGSRTILAAGSDTTVLFSLLAGSSATPGVNVFTSSNGTMATSTAVGWDFDTGGATVGDIYDFKNNGTSLATVEATLFHAKTAMQCDGSLTVGDGTGTDPTIIADGALSSGSFFWDDAAASNSGGWRFDDPVAIGTAPSAVRRFFVNWTTNDASPRGLYFTVKDGGSSSGSSLQGFEGFAQSASSGGTGATAIIGGSATAEWRDGDDGWSGSLRGGNFTAHISDLGVNSSISAGVYATVHVQGIGAGITLTHAHAIYAEPRIRAGSANVSNLYGLRVQPNIDASHHTLATYYGIKLADDNSMVCSDHYGIHIDAYAGTCNDDFYGIVIESPTGTVTGDTWGINCLEDIQIGTGKNLVLEGTKTVKGDTTLGYSSGTSSVSLAVNGTTMFESSSSQMGFFNTAIGSQPSGYTTFANLSTDRTCDANSTTVEELADILGTLIEDLKTLGLVAA